MFTTDEHQHEVNKLLHEAMPVLQEHGIALRVGQRRLDSPDSHYDLVARLDAGARGHRDYAVEVRPRLSSANAKALPPTKLPLLLITPYVSRATADVLRRSEVDFVDLAGNLSIRWPSLLINIVGNRPREPQPKPSRRAPRAFSTAGAKVLFTVLSWPDTLTLPLRSIADRSGVSLGTTQIVLNELVASGYIYSAHGRKTLTNGRELLDRWAEAFTTSVSHKLAFAEFRDKSDRWWQGSRELLLESGVQLGGEAAGSVLDPHLIPTTTLLYCDAFPRPVIAQRHWSRADRDSNVVLRQRFWSAPEPLDPLVPSTLIYADMWGSGDPRQREHAERIRQHDNRLVQLDRS
ncbi:type IV toxin-antitoxin system AbiEi family antitoxin [Nocardia sp. NBC_00508]|uniref:type IV toxin-antitoxin system AbiEi family antitoxin n=1 Tax=Nocardia sp. NBC_00508 TaxID=2975992 RepID=UPI002E80520D|nr:type IV toxin-antitoxin system AbiEi family antitoxin [Nocardia sp. NBC_00508]WUD63568.1 type IV toxin-antitoxin system AbiEi family antitoxin [Nocardia sp. NBC_00508]